MQMRAANSPPIGHYVSRNRNSIHEKEQKRFSIATRSGNYSNEELKISVVRDFFIRQKTTTLELVGEATEASFRGLREEAETKPDEY